MLKFTFGLIVGIVAVYGTTTFADTPKATISNSGRLVSVSVLNADGKKVCDEPWAHKEQGVIRCE